MAEPHEATPGSSGEPWWYSGPPEQARSEGRAGDGGARDDGARDDGAAADGSGAVDWMAMLAGAARMVDWARGAVLDPHAEHVDPADHPDCMICRTIVVVGDQVGMPARGRGESSGRVPEGPHDVEPMRWLTLRDGRPGADPVPTKAR